MRLAFLHPDSLWHIVIALLIEYGVYIVAAVAAFVAVGLIFVQKSRPHKI